MTPCMMSGVPRYSQMAQTIMPPTTLTAGSITTSNQLHFRPLLIRCPIRTSPTISAIDAAPNTSFQLTVAHDVPGCSCILLPAQCADDAPACARFYNYRLPA